MHGMTFLSRVIGRGHALTRPALCSDSRPARPQEAQARHEMALELLGERNETVEELEDSIAEMKCATLPAVVPSNEHPPLHHAARLALCFLITA